MTAFWDGRILHLWDEKGRKIAAIPGKAPEHGALEIPSPDEAKPNRLILPLEQVLLRPFSLPLPHPRLLDAKILGQELTEQAGIEPAEWWLAWQANSAGGGVAGLVFGLPASVRARLGMDTAWQACRFIGADAWLRLNALAPESRAPDYAVLDTDAEGLFAGVFRAGAWQGMRRLNLIPGRALGAIADDAMRSLHAMGFTPDAMPVYGRLDETWHAALGAAQMDWRGEITETLPDRAAATCLAARPENRAPGPNFRHGAWAKPGGWRKRAQPWRRTAVLAVLLLLLLTGNNIHRNHQLEKAQLRIQSDIEAAFHRGLPNEKVMLDPLVQLRKAAGSGTASDAWFFLHQIQAAGNLKQKVRGLHIAVVQFTGKTMRLTATAPDLASVNRARDVLSSMLGLPVKVEDTQLMDKQVRFRLQWS